MAKILVAEDDRVVLRSIGEFLRRSGYQVEDARDEIEAFDLLAMDGFDLVLSDVFMPHARA
jgi:CheY-like chemotaxis protein